MKLRICRFSKRRKGSWGLSNFRLPILDFRFRPTNRRVRGKNGQANVKQCDEGDLKMDFFFRSQTLLDDRFSDWRRGRPFSRNLLVVGLTAVLSGFSVDVFAQTIKLGYAALTAGQVAPWIAKEAGYFSKYGIEAELIYIPAVAATQALIAGEIQLAQATGVSTSGAILAGADVRIIASVQDRLSGSIYARPEIKTPEDLKGKKLGISRFGAVSETGAAMFLARFGLTYPYGHNRWNGKDHAWDTHVIGFLVITVEKIGRDDFRIMACNRG